MKMSTPDDFNPIDSSILGRGSGGVIKIVDHDTVVKFSNEEGLEGLTLTEIAVLFQMNSDLIAKGKSVVVVEDICGITMERYSQTLSNKYFMTLSIAQRLKLIHSIVESLSQLYQSDLIYGDVKLDNFMIDTQGNLKLIDFGSVYYGKLPARMNEGRFGLTTPSSSLFSPSGGSINYYPYTNGDQLFAVGTLLYELATGYHLYSRKVTEADFDLGTPAVVKWVLPEEISGLKDPEFSLPHWFDNSDDEPVYNNSIIEAFGEYSDLFTNLLRRLTNYLNNLNPTAPSKSITDVLNDPIFVGMKLLPFQFKYHSPEISVLIFKRLKDLEQQSLTIKAFIQTLNYMQTLTNYRKGKADLTDDDVANLIWIANSVTEGSYGRFENGGLSKLVELINELDCYLLAPVNWNNLIRCGMIKQDLDQPVFQLLSAPVVPKTSLSQLWEANIEDISRVLKKPIDNIREGRLALARNYIRYNYLSLDDLALFSNPNFERWALETDVLDDILRFM
jgi:serine/threonine protein kinase